MDVNCSTWQLDAMPDWGNCQVFNKAAFLAETKLHEICLSHVFEVDGLALLTFALTLCLPTGDALGSQQWKLSWIVEAGMAAAWRQRLTHAM